jgi:hypothetical protein
LFRCAINILGFILHYYGAEVGRNTDDKKSKQVFMTSLRSRKMPEFSLAVRRIKRVADQNCRLRGTSKTFGGCHLEKPTTHSDQVWWFTFAPCFFLNTRPDSALVSFLDLEDLVLPPSY